MNVVEIIGLTMKILLGLFVSTLLTPLALACSCVEPNNDLSHYGQLHTGYFTEVKLHKGPSKKTPPYYEIEGKFEVTATYKGERVPLLTLRTYVASRNCGMPIVVGVEYLVALESEGASFLSRCSATGPLSTKLRDQLQAIQ